jgi:hypothetical protein
LGPCEAVAHVRPWAIQSHSLGNPLVEG